MNLSRTEFLSQLVNSCSGDPHTLASEYLRLEEEGEMSVASIYLRFTDSYFYDLRPEQALARLQEVTSGKSKYSSLSEAEMEADCSEWFLPEGPKHPRTHEFQKVFFENNP